MQIAAKEGNGEIEEGIRQDYMQIVYLVHEACILSKVDFGKK
jgi:hypothetical protein